MEILNENIQYENPFLCMKIFEAKRTSTSRAPLGQWHYHKEMEVLAIMEGEIELHVEDEYFTLTAGDVLIIGSSQLHRDRIMSATSRYYVFQFDMQYYIEPSVMLYYKLFMEPGFPLSRLNYIFRENDEARQLVQNCVRRSMRSPMEKITAMSLPSASRLNGSFSACSGATAADC